MQIYVSFRGRDGGDCISRMDGSVGKNIFHFEEMKKIRIKK